MIARRALLRPFGGGAAPLTPLHMILLLTGPAICRPETWHSRAGREYRQQLIDMGLAPSDPGHDWAPWATEKGLDWINRALRTPVEKPQSDIARVWTYMGQTLGEMPIEKLDEAIEHVERVMRDGGLEFATRLDHRDFLMAAREERRGR